jgi:microcin C transport system permease protein
MLAYLLRRLVLIIPTLFGIMLLNFVIIQAAPGGPVEQVLARLKGTDVGATARLSGGGGEGGIAARGEAANRSRGTRGIDPELIRELERQFGFDRPAHERCQMMRGASSRFDFGESFYRNRSVVDLVLDRSPRYRSRSGSGRPSSCTSSRFRSASPRRFATAPASTCGPRRS